MAKRGLGRGLEGMFKRGQQDDSANDAPDASPPDVPPPDVTPAVVSSTEPTGITTPGRIAIRDILVSAYQPRKHFDAERLREMADSIREQGLLQPLAVRQHPTEAGKVELIAGERRLRAVKTLGWDDVPAVLIDTGDKDMRELALVENLQRADLNPIEIAEAYRALQNEAELRHEDIAKRVGISRAQITNTLRLLELPEEIKALVAENAIASGHARALLALPDALSQIRIAKRIVNENLTTRDVEALVKKAKHPSEKSASKPKSKPDAQLADLERRLREHLGTKVTIRPAKGKTARGGTIEIDYYSADDATRLLGRMGLGEEL